MNSTRKTGKKLEDYACDLLSKSDKYCKRTNNSGAVSNNGDIQHKMFLIECKKRNTNSVTIDRKVWLKLCSQIKIGSLKVPLLILENDQGERWAVTQLDDFTRLLPKDIGD